MKPSRPLVLVSAIAMLVALLPGSSSLAAPDSTARKELETACKKASELKRYTFGMTVSIIGLPSVTEPVRAEGAHRDGTTHVAATFRKTEYEVYARGAAVVSKTGDGAWEKAGAGAGPGGMGVGALAEQVKVVPHGELAELAGKLETVERGEAKEDVDGHPCTVYEGELTEEAAKAMIPPQAAMFGLSGEVVGLARAWVDAEGVVRRFEMTAAMRADFQGQQLEIGMNRTTELAKIGEAELTVPDDVEEMLGGEGEEDGSTTPR